MKPRPYQQDAIDKTLECYDRGTPAALIVMPTGCGKTIVFSHVLDQMIKKGGRAIVIAHRDELLSQAMSKIKLVSGEHCSLEKADSWSNETSLFQKSNVVVSSVQTQNAGRLGGRMQRFDPFEFVLLIIDEAHHATSKTYRNVINYYRTNPNLKVLGVTATPDRADTAALGKVFDEAPYSYAMTEAITDGWLVPIEQQLVDVESLDFSKCKTTAGDLNAKELGEIMVEENNLHEVVGPTIEIAAGRKTLVFAVTVMQAERMSEIFNRHKKNSAMVVTGKTETEARKGIMKGFDSGDFQFLVNVGVCTEGFDVPSIEIVAIARPTKSRSLYTQMVGRGTRPLPGVVDGPQTAEGRKDAIASSGKSSALILDFVGNSGRHKLVTTSDILGGDYDDDVIERAKRKTKKLGNAVDMMTMLADANDEIIAEKERMRIAEEKAKNRRSVVKGQAKYRIGKVNPFDVLAIEAPRDFGGSRDPQSLATPRQIAALERFGVEASKMNGATKAIASALLSDLFRRRDAGMATYKQVKRLKSCGYENANEMTRAEAGAAMGELSRNGWRRRRW